MIGFFEKIFGKKQSEVVSKPEHLPDIPRYAENQNGSGEVDLELLEVLVPRSQQLACSRCSRAIISS